MASKLVTIPSNSMIPERDIDKSVSTWGFSLAA